MERSDPRYQAYVEILKEELIPAMGCTEPIALAYAAAKAREVLTENIDELHRLVQIQPYRGKIVVPGQGKARSTRRNAEFGFSFHSILFRSCSCTFCKQERCFCAKAEQLLSAKTHLPVK